MRAVAAALSNKTRDLRKKVIEKPYRKLLAITARVARQTARPSVPRSISSALGTVSWADATSNSTSVRNTLKPAARN